VAKSPARTPIKRAFRLSPNLIRTLVRNQSGTLQKALMEGISNSMDAGADEIRLTVKERQIVIEDNGAGLKTAEEIFAVFEVFGFDHSELDRAHGRFGVGRGQMFCFGKNEWRTNNFAMSVDVDKNGFDDYEFEDDLPKIKGMRIAIDLYKPLSVAERYALEEDLGKLTKYAAIPILFNGKRLNQDVTKIKWTNETPETWFNVRKEGELQVYSQGLLVQSFANHRYGMGGVVVTKPGHALEMNLARNDLLVNSCPLWKVIAKKLATLAVPFAKKSAKENTITPDQRQFMARAALEPANIRSLFSDPLFTLTNGRHLNLERALWSSVWAIGATGDIVADKLNQRRDKCILAEENLIRWGVDTAAELKTRLIQAMERALPEASPYPSREAYDSPVRQAWQARDSLRNTLGRHLERLRGVTIHETVATLAHEVNSNQEEVPKKQLTADERAILTSLNRCAQVVVRGVNQASDPGTEPRRLRELRVMNSEVAAATTDGHSHIWLNRSVLKYAREGLTGFIKLTSLMAHEYVHSTDSQGSHVHDQAFFELFHDAVRGGELTRAGILALGSYARATGLKPTKALMEDLDHAFDTGDVVLFHDEGAEDTPEPSPTPTAPIQAAPAKAAPIKPATPKRRGRSPA
jgi:hypothetical protein